MDYIKKMIFNNEKGFALLAAIIASLILMAIGLLVINMSTGDLTTSSITVGHKKALAAAESGVHRLIQDFNVVPATGIALHYSANCATAAPVYEWKKISDFGGTGVDDNSEFAVCPPTVGSLAPLAVPGYDIGDWGLMRYDASVVGNNTSYRSFSRVNIGIGYGPVPMK
jgi:hypothetical protein